MTNRIDHTGHGHPATTKARTACRKAMAPIKVGDMVKVWLDDARSACVAKVIEVRVYEAYVPTGRGEMVWGTARSYTLDVPRLGHVRSYENRVEKA